VWFGGDEGSMPTDWLGKCLHELKEDVYLGVKAKRAYIIRKKDRGKSNGK
jgi:hypothetical protein